MNDVSVGDRVRLIHTADALTRLLPGDEGTVTRVETEPDLIIAVRWDSGSTLSMIPDLGDRIERVTT